MNTEINTLPQEHLFTEEDQFNYTEASVGQRFLNYLIDTIFMQYGLGYASGFIIAKIVMAISPETAYDLFVIKKDSFDVLFSFYLITITNFFIYYTFCENVFNGKTLGKLITGTKVVNLDGTKSRFTPVFLRTLSRMVPFEPFSAFSGNPWHDRWTKTMVVKTR